MYKIVRLESWFYVNWCSPATSPPLNFLKWNIKQLLIKKTNFLKYICFLVIFNFCFINIKNRCIQSNFFAYLPFDDCDNNVVWFRCKILSIICKWCMRQGSEQFVIFFFEKFSSLFVLKVFFFLISLRKQHLAIENSNSVKKLCWQILIISQNKCVQIWEN